MRLSGIAFSLALFAVTTVGTGCAANADDEEDAASTSEDALLTKADTAKCVTEGGNVSFTISFSGTYRAMDRYMVSNVVMNGVSTPGTFSAYNSPLGKNLKWKTWNGFPLLSSALVTESRVTTEWRANNPGIGGRVKCVADLGPNPQTFDRFRLAYEYQATEVFPARRDPRVLKYVGAATTSTLPANLQRRARDYQRTFSTWEFEGQRLYMIETSSWELGPVTTLFRNFYRADGTAFGVVVLPGNYQLRTEMLTPEEWEIAPKRTLYWHSGS